MEIKGKGSERGFLSPLIGTLVTQAEAMYTCRDLRRHTAIATAV